LIKPSKDFLVVLFSLTILFALIAGDVLGEESGVVDSGWYESCFAPPFFDGLGVEMMPTELIASRVDDG